MADQLPPGPTPTGQQKPYLSPLLPEGIDPLNEAAACRAAVDCLNAVGQLLQVRNHANQRAEITEQAVLYCLHRLDSAYHDVDHYHYSYLHRKALARAIEFTRRVRKTVWDAVEEFKESLTAPREGWRIVWDIYREKFNSSLGPTWADAESRPAKMDCDEKGLLGSGTIFIPKNAIERPWHPLALDHLWESLNQFEFEEALDLLRELTATEEGASDAVTQPAAPPTAGTEQGEGVGPGPHHGGPGEGPDGPQWVTLDKAAALVNRKKKTLLRALNKLGSKMPRPDIEGMGGKPHEWLWSRLRPWLEQEYGRKLPNRYPTLQR